MQITSVLLLISQKKSLLKELVLDGLIGISLGFLKSTTRSLILLKACLLRLYSQDCIHCCPLATQLILIYCYSNFITLMVRLCFLYCCFYFTEPHQKHSIQAAQSMKTTTARLPLRTPCTTPMPRLWRGRLLDSIQI